MSLINCQECSKSFYCKPSRLSKGWGKYCSNECKHILQKTGEVLACSFCEKPCYKSIHDQLRSKSGLYFCNKSCQTKWRNTRVYIGSNHANWKSGIAAYRDILKRTHRLELCGRCLTRDTRILAVHHMDKDRHNNEPENLIWLCHNCHYLVHHYPNESLGFLTQPS